MQREALDGNNDNCDISSLYFSDVHVYVQVLLIVNVASECGYTHTHYIDLVKLQEDLEFTGLFDVLAFPCNQFGEQEPQVMNKKSICNL